MARRDVVAYFRVGELEPKARRTSMLLDYLHYEGADSAQRAFSILDELWRTGYEPAQDPFVSKYLPGQMVRVEVAPGIEAEMPLGRDALGLLLAEHRQAAHDLRGAVSIVEAVQPTTLAAVSLAELYAAQKRWDAVVDLTNGLAGNDDFTIFLLTQRGVALREQGFFEASREAFKASLARRSQPSGLKHRTLLERSLTYRAEGKKAMARKDLERILAEDSTYPGLAHALTELS